MTLTFRPARRRMKRRIETLPAATSVSHRCEIWVRRHNRLVCRVCWKP